MGIKKGSGGGGKVLGPNGRSARREGSGWLAGSDFVELEEPKKQANTLIFGDAGQGKTTFCTMYAPQPLAFISLDRRGDHAVMRAKETGRKIAFLRVDFPANITKLGDELARKKGQEAVGTVIDNFEWAVEQSQKGNVRTIAIDTGTEYSELLNIALTGRPDRTKGDYGKSKDLMNREWWRLFNLAREGEAHLIVLARAQAIWLNNEPTGRFKARGPEVMNDAVDWAGHIRLKQPKGKKVRGKPKFELEITKAGINISELGEVYTEEEWGDLGGPFVYSCLMQYDGSDVDDWE